VSHSFCAALGAAMATPGRHIDEPLGVPTADLGEDVLAGQFGVLVDTGVSLHVAHQLIFGVPGNDSAGRTTQSG